MMTTKRAILRFDSDTNQLPYDGDPGTYYDWDAALIKVDGAVEIDSRFDDDGVPVAVNKFSFSWPQLSPLYSPVLMKYRVRNDQLSTQSNWSVPLTIYVPVRYAIYKRRLSLTSNEWTLVEVTKTPYVGPYQENWAGRVQYAVCIHHVDAVPASSEGIASATDFENPYVLFATDPDSTTMNTKPFIT